jgi:uncharacterized iron-regulated membrane protein
MALRPAALLKRSLIFVHRWLGVALAALFAMWFVSGIVMMYWGFPGITAEDRLSRALTLEPGQIKLTPEDAYVALGREQPAASVRLTSFDGRPVYQFGGGGGGRGGGGGGRGGGGASMVFADDGSVRGAADGALVDRAAASWAGLPIEDATKESVEEVDQWTVAGQLRNLRPMFKYTFSDGQQVYVNGNTADVVQYTTSASRFWAYLGAIPHWLYFTPLRQHQQQWFSFVVYSSLIGTIAALMGVVIAVWMYSPRKRYRYAGAATSIPYRSWKRWHTILGLFFGVLVTTWTFSGLLSMGPFPIIDKITALTVPSDPPPPNAGGAGAAANAGGGAGRGRGGGRGPNIAGALRGGGRFELGSYAARTPAQALALVPQFDVKELEYSSFAGQPVYMATNAGGETRIIPMTGQPQESFGTQQVLEIVERAAGKNLAEIKVIDQYDAYYLDRRREAPLPVVYARLNDAASTRFYVDPKTARVVGNYSSRGWINRWLYHGLHSLDFPWLYNYRPLWDIVVITLMLGGTAVCVTSLVLAWQVLVRKVMGFVKPLATRPTDDLAVES